MGNCLIHGQDKVVKIMNLDGKILEYQTPLKVHQVLSEFSGYAISDALPVHQHLGLDTKLLSGRLYYLLPPPLMPSIDQYEKKTLIESNTTVEIEHGTTRVVRIKLVITKQELKEMISKGGDHVSSSSVDEMISQIQNNKESKDCNFVDDEESCRGWRPILASIPE